MRILDFRLQIEDHLPVAHWPLELRVVAYVLKRYHKPYFMPDDPNKKGGADRKRISQQPHEQAYQKRKAKQSGESGRTSSERGSSQGRSSSGGSGRSSSRSKE